VLVLTVVLGAYTVLAQSPSAAAITANTQALAKTDAICLERNCLTRPPRLSTLMDVLTPFTRSETFLYGILAGRTSQIPKRQTGFNTWLRYYGYGMIK
jgi:hypothetical protein